MPHERNTIFNRICDLLPRLWLPLLMALCFAYAWRPLSGGDDVWAHAAIGRWMAGHGAVPRESLFLWGAPPQPWVYHSWLSQLTFYNLLSRGEVVGPAFILLLTALIVTTVFVLLWRAWTARSGGATIWMPLVFSLAVYCSSLRFRPRPELFSALFLTLLLLFLIREKPRQKESSETPKPRRTLLYEVLFIFALFVLWTNFHGAVAVGLVMLGAMALMELAQEQFARRSWKWLLLLGVGVLAVCVNPYGMEYWQALRPVGGEMFERIDEWKPFWKTPPLNLTMVAGEFVLVWVALLCWLGNKERRWTQLAWLVLMAALFISARRHLWLLPIVSLTVIAANARTLSTLALSTPSLTDLLTPFARSAARLVATIVLVMVLLFSTSLERVSPGPVASQTPHAATAYFQQQNLGARGFVFNDYENSSYLQWSFGGHPPLYIDLLNAYPDQLLFDYLDIANARPRGQKLLEEQKVQTVILRAYNPDSALAKLAKYLNANNKRWRRVYSAGDGTIWRRMPDTESS